MTFQSCRTLPNKSLHFVYVLLLTAPLLFTNACGGGGSNSGGGGGSSPTITSVSVSCTPTSVQTGQTSQCSAVVSGTGSYSSAVTWSAASGTISSSGLYTAPATVPASGSDTVTATSTQDSTKTGSAKVTVTAVPVTVTSVAVVCTPTSILTTQTSTCTPTVTGTGNFSNTVTWSVSPSSIGAVSSAGIFTPATTGTATVMATSAQDTTQSGTATVTVNPLPSPTTPVIVPSILVASQQAQVTVTCFVSGADSDTQVQLFDLASGTPVLIGTMTDDGENGDQTGGDQIYTIVTSLTPPAASSLPLQVVATTGTAGVESANFAVQLVQIPSYTANSDLNQAESQIYNTAIQTRMSFSSPTWSSSTLLPTMSSNLVSMYGQFTGVVNQNADLQSATMIVKKTTTSDPQSTGPRADGILGSILNVLTFGLLSPAQNANSCNQLLQSLGGFRGDATVPVLSLDDPGLQQFAQELATICTTASSCQGAFGVSDFLGGNLAAAEWAQEYIVSGQPLPTSIDGCGGGITQSVDNVAVTSEVGQFTDLAGDGLTSLAGGGQISQQLTGYANDILVGAVVDSSGSSTLIIGQVGANQTLPAPTGTYNLAASFGGDTANATITNTPVYPNSITNIAPLPGTILWLDPPEIQSFSPTFGPVGTPVTLSGYGFNPPSGSLTSITFNGINATVSSATDSSMTVAVPPGATTGPITVITTVGETMSSVSFAVTASAGNPLPTITGLNPSSLAAGATPQTLTINGTGFLDSSTVTFNGVAYAATFVNESELTISLTSTDLATAGNYPVVVTNPAPGGGSSGAADFTVTNSQTANEWRWMSGANTIMQAAVYGELGTYAAGNVPGARDLSVSWTDSGGHLWLFGGEGINSTDTSDDWLNDLWEYAPASGEWRWMSGSSNTANNAGVYGALGTYAAGNVPGSRDVAVSWTDADGHLWLFGGNGYDSAGNFNILNDLWEYDPASGEWRWMSGSGTVNNFGGVWGTQGVYAAGNVPGPRGSSVTWTDAGGNLWLFGGDGYDSTGTQGPLNDLWEYNPTSGEWRWMSGSSTIYSVGVYGALGAYAAGNVPGARYAPVSWIDPGGNLWLFGGATVDSAGNWYLLNDLWEYSPSIGEWRWMSGSSTVNSAGVYGALGAYAAGNVPGARDGSVSWTDASGNLWLFGGTSKNSAGNEDWLNDLWEYSPSSGEWRWMSGSSTVNSAGVYGALGAYAAGNVPGARDSSVSWTDAIGNLWLFGGLGYDSAGNWNSLNDLWEYQP